MPQSNTGLYYHIIFSTKNRVPYVDDDLAERLHVYIGGIIRDYDGSLLAIGGMPDHVHLLAMISKRRSISDALRIIKTNSSRWVHQTFVDRAAFAWQSGYGAFTVSPPNIDRVRRYILMQREHHRAMTFQEEYLRFLDRYHVPYDERYLWD